MTKGKTVQIFDEDVEKMLKESWTEDRDYLYLMIAKDTGARVGEIYNIRPQDIDWPNKRIWTPKAKYDGTGWLLFTPETERELQKWIKKNGIAPSKQIWACSYRTLQRIPERYAARAGIWNPKAKDGKRPSCHSFRAYFATKLIDCGLNEFQVQRLMRHRNLSTTGIYYRHSAGAVRDDYDRAMGQKKLSP